MAFGISAGAYLVGGAMVGSSLIGANASKSAAGAQAAAAQQANETQMAQYNQTREDQAPWRERGNAAGERLNFLLGLPGGSSSSSSAPTRDQIRNELLKQYTSTPPSSMQYSTGGGENGMQGSYYDQAGQPTVDEAGLNAAIDRRMAEQEAQAKAAQAAAQTDPAYGSLMRNFSAQDFTADPGYYFRLSEGMRGINNSAAARGGILSGAALKAASKYNQNFASNEYSNVYNRFQTNQTNQFNRLASIAGVGQTATNQVAAAGQNMANNVSNNQLSAGNARASGYVGQANALSGAVGQGWNMYQGNQLMNSLGGNNWGGPTGGIGGYGDEMARLNASIG